MFKRGIYLFLVFILLFIPIGEVYSQSMYSIGINNGGYLNVGSSNYGDNMRVLVQKDRQKYYYSLSSDLESIPLQLGNGKYTVKVLENIQGKRYKVVDKKEINFDDFNTNKAFLSSSQPVYWDKSHIVLNLAKEITKDAQTDYEKVEKIYNYVIKNIEYDDNKINYLKDNYVPDINDTLNSKKGICYDYASTFAGLLRSLSIPTKLVKGYKDDLKSYHAWNEVLIEGNWEIIDTTYDAALQKASKNVKIIKEENKYEKIREY